MSTTAAVPSRAPVPIPRCGLCGGTRDAIPDLGAYGTVCYDCLEDGYADAVLDLRGVPRPEPDGGAPPAEFAHHVLYGGYAYDAFGGVEAAEDRAKVEAAFQELFDGLGGDAAVPLDHPARKADDAALTYAQSCFDVGVRVGIELEHLRRAILGDPRDVE